VKPSDLADGISRMSLAGSASKEKEKDVVSKGLLAQSGMSSFCIRCGGKSEVGGDVRVAGHLSLRWKSWERVWTIRCTCGGLWAR
jgi:hypothetical protein